PTSRTRTNEPEMIGICARRRRIAASVVWLLSLVLGAGSAYAQPTPRGQPVIRTPPAKPTAAPTAAPATPPPGGAPPAKPPANPPPPRGNPPTPPGPGTPPAKPGPAAPNQPGEKPDDMGLKQAPKEIEFKPAPAGATFQFNLEDADLPELVK